MRKALLAATLFCGPLSAWAEDVPYSAAQRAQIDAIANAANSPITGAGIAAGIVPVDRPPSLEALMAARPGVNPEAKIPEGRAAILKEAGTSYGAAGGLYARGYALNRMLERHEFELDRTYDFRRVIIPLGGGDTLLLPPVVSEAQRAMALEQGGQRARTTGKIYRITRDAEIGSEPPNWRTFLVQTWSRPQPPTDSARPRTSDEVKYWEQVVAAGWALGETQAVQVFLAKLATLDTTLIGMFRYKELLDAGMVEKPTVTMHFRRVQGGGAVMRLNDTDLEIRKRSGLTPTPGRWRSLPSVPADGPISQPRR